MRNTNTIRPQKYIGDHLLWLITAMLWYRGVLFTAIPGMTVKQSKIILWISALVLVAFGYIITMKKRRNNLSLFTNILLPYELYAVVTDQTGLEFGTVCQHFVACLYHPWYASNDAQRTAKCRGAETSSCSQPARSQDNNRYLYLGFDSANRCQQGVRAWTDDHKNAARFFSI